MDDDYKNFDWDSIGFDFDWDEKKVWALDLPVTEMDTKELLWHFEVPFWEKDDTDDWNLSPRDVIDGSPGSKQHRQRVDESNLEFPIDIMENNGRWLILDGLHRLVRLYELGQEKIKIRIVPRSKIPEILKK